MRLIRTFHPIGQGALYTERHFIGNKEFSIVYDCGSSTFEKKVFEKKIKSIFPKNNIIDVLFISHFHSDHTNGISILNKHCKIKRVVLPFLSPEAKVILKVSNYILANSTDTQLIDSPNDFFGGKIPIITIKERDNLIDESAIPPEYNYILHDLNQSKTVDSGSVFALLKEEDWFFIPFNYKNEILLNLFINALSKVNLELNDIDTIDKIELNRKKIINAYKKIDRDLNKNSLVLFSGRKKDDCLKCFGHFKYLYYHECYESGCLYLGDVDLKQINIVKDIKIRLRLFLDYIGTIQVPHHGSIHNFDSSILDGRFINTIISFGINNNYGHPSDRVIEEIISNEAIPHLITEHQDTIVSQWM